VGSALVLRTGSLTWFEVAEETPIMTRIFVLTNHKGGVGKSTSATNIALGLVGVLRSAGAPNSRVLLIDTDSQAHATLVTTGHKDYGVDNSLYTVLTAERADAAQTMANCIVPSTWDADLHVLPASPLLQRAEQELMRVAGAPYRLADPLVQIASHYAAVVIETRPSFSLLREMGLLAATDAIVPVEPR
jgi:chromosome partitioning protein